MDNKIAKVAGFLSATVVSIVAMAAVAYAQTAPTASTVATTGATGLKDEFLPAMVAAIPIVVVVIAAKRGWRFVKGQ